MLLQGLSVLDLGGCGRLSPAVLVDLAEGLPRLSRLGLAHTQANVQVLSAVGSCCRRLRELDVSGCKKVTPRALRHLGYDPVERSPGCPALRVLLARDLEEHAGDAVTAVAFLLLALPRLEVLAHGAAPDALRLLRSGQLDGTEDSEGFPSLEELARGRGAAAEGAPLTLALRQLEEVEEDALGAVHAVCPQAEELSVWLGDSPGPSELRELPGWKCLSRLTLGCSGRHGRALAELLPLAQGLGSRLRALTLHGFSCRDPLSLPALLASYPGLQSFSAELEVPPDPRARHDEPHEEEPPNLPPRWATDLLPRGLPRLQSFSLSLAGPVPAAHGPVLSSTLASLLCQAPRLQSLRLLAVPFPLDSVLEPALAGLRELRELALAQSRVSPGTVWQLLGSDGPLRRLDLSRCPDIHRRDYDGFLQAVRKQRLELDITWE